MLTNLSITLLLLFAGGVIALVWWLNDLPDDRNDWRRK